MARIDDLKPDQRAALQLLMQQGRSYDDIAQMLRIDQSAVRERAHAALDALGPEDVEDLTLEQQDEVADYLLGQQTASQRAGTRQFLESSAPARAWARVVSGELRPMAGDNLPDVPAEAAEVDEAFGALGARKEHRERVERSSRVGGVILIAAAVIVLVGLVALGVSLLGGDDEGDDSPDAAQTTTTGTGTGTSTTGGQDQPQIETQINLTPPGGGSDGAVGVAQIASQGGKRLVALAAEGLPQANRQRFYAIWLYSSADKAKRLGFPRPQPGREGRMQTSFELPEDAGEFERLVVTRETRQQPERPGTIVLSGPLEGDAEPQTPGAGGAEGAGGAGGQAPAPAQP